MTDRRRPDASEMSPREAKARFIRRRKNDRSESTVKSYHGRLKLFVEWCESVGITTVGDIQPYDINEYYDIRSGDAKATSVENEMYTLRQFSEYLEKMGATEYDLGEKVPFPDIDREERSSDVKLHQDRALPLIKHFREHDDVRASRKHAFLELAWFTGARIGGLRALDLRDVYRNEHYVEFRHRPDTDTPLKNKTRGERPVAVPQPTMSVLAEYIDENRYDVHDEHGRQPLLASTRGRPNPNTLRIDCYWATQPCARGSCPHGKEIPDCIWTERNHVSKCPSARSPHQVRTGSITWQLNRGVPRPVVSERCNTDQIEQFYDKPDEDERWRRFRDQMEKERRSYVDSLEPFKDE